MSDIEVKEGLEADFDEEGSLRMLEGILTDLENSEDAVRSFKLCLDVFLEHHVESCGKQDITLKGDRYKVVQRDGRYYLRKKRS